MTTDELLESIYHDAGNKGSLGGVNRLLAAAKEIDPTIKRKDVVDWLRENYVYTLHHPLRRRFPRNKVVVSGANDEIQVDLVDLSMFSKENDNTKFLLCAIDVFTKKALVIPLENKTAKALVGAMKQVIDTFSPQTIFSDKGSEFKNAGVAKLLKDSKINQSFANNPQTKASVIERFNRSLKMRMFRLMTQRGSRRYIDKLSDLLTSYNNTVHRSISRTPNEVTDDNEADVFRTIYGTTDIKDLWRNEKKPKFSVGDSVRVPYTLSPLDKSYYPLYGDHVFTIKRVFLSQKLPTYQLLEGDGTLVKRRFYGKELQLVSPNTSYRIEKIIRRKGNKVLVRYLNHGPNYDQWIAADTIVRAGIS